MTQAIGQDFIFLLSMPRSGSTLLSLMLGSHPEICCPPEPWVALAATEYLDLTANMLAPYGRDIADIAAFEFLLGIESAEPGALSGIVRSALSAADREGAAINFLGAAYQAKLKVSGKRFFVDKTPRYYVILELLERLFPASKKIVLLRNPLDIFASYKDTWEISRQIFDPQFVSVLTRDFCEGLFVQTRYVGSKTENVLVVQYEELVVNQDAELKRICEFLGVEYCSAMRDFNKNAELLEEYRRSPVGDPGISTSPRPASGKSVSGWRGRLEFEDIQALVNVVGIRVFEQLGYLGAVSDLEAMGISIPSEGLAAERREQLMVALTDKVKEKPFSAWSGFVEPLKGCLADRAARLAVIHEQWAELEKQRSEFDTLRVRLEAAIHEQWAELEKQRSEFDTLRVRLEAAQQDLKRARTLSGIFSFYRNRLADFLSRRSR